MKTIRLTARVDEKRRLSVQVPAEVAPGSVQILVILPSGEDEAGEQWASGVAREWEAELADPREDLYSLSDGEPVNVPR